MTVGSLNRHIRLTFKMRVIENFVLLLLLSCVGFSSDHCNQPLTWNEGDACCRSRGLDLPGVSNLGDVRIVSDLASAKDMVSVWVSMRKKQLPSWTWIDGTQDRTPYLVGAYFGDCAVYLPKRKQMTEANCSNKTLGVVCEIKDCSDCRCGKFLPTCVLHNNKSYVYLCQDLTWHKARAYCAKEGWRLAVFPGSIIRGSPRKMYCDKFWIGLRRKDWKQPYGGYSENGEEFYTLWDQEEPREHGRCSVLSLSPGGWKLRVQSCQTKTTFLCNPVAESTPFIKGQEPLTTDLTSISHSNSFQFPNSDNKTKRLSMHTFVGGLVGGIAVVVFMAAMCTVAYLVGRRRNCSKGIRGRKLEKEEETSMQLTKENISGATLIKELLTASMMQRYSRISQWSWFDDHVTVDMNELYTDLVWTQRHDLNTSDQIKEYTDMFKLRNKQWSLANIFLVGDAGTGKSTFVRKIATDWCTIMHSDTRNLGSSNSVEISSEVHCVMKTFEIVILLCLRDIKERQSLVGAISDQLGLRKEEATNLYDLISDNERKTLLIFDGYDEYRDSTSKHITDVLYRKKLQYTNLMITSRHPRSFHYPTEKAPAATEVCLRGFSPRGTTEFIEKFFKGAEAGRELQKQINRSEYLAHLSHFPAVLLLMSMLWRATNQLSDSITGFYQDFIKYLCDRYEQKYIRQQDRSKPDEIAHIYHKYLMKIGKIAIRGMKKDKLDLVFPYNKVRTTIGKTAWKFGFFAEEGRPGKERMVTFPHKTLQEFFVAYYLVHVHEKQQKQLLIMFCESKQAVRESEVILTFVQGLGGMEIHKHIQTILAGDDETLQLHVDLQLTYLSQHQGAKLVLPSVVKLETNKHPLTIYAKYLECDKSALKRLVVYVHQGYKGENDILLQELISKACRTQVLEELVIKETKQSTIDDIIEYLPNTNMRRLCLSSCRLSLQQASSLLIRLPDCHSLMDIDMSNNNLRGLMDRKDCLTALTRCHLTTLNLSNSYVTPDDVRSLLVTLPDCPSLTNLDISENYLGGVMGKMGYDIQLIGYHLKTLNMTGCGLTSGDVRLLLDGLPNCRSLTNLDLSGNNLSGLMGRTDKPRRLTNSHLITLNMSECGLTSRDILSLLTIIPFGLNNLDVSRNFAGEELEEIKSMTGQLTNLRKLNLENNDLNGAQLTQINQTFTKKCPKLKLIW